MKTVHQITPFLHVPDFAKAIAHFCEVSFGAIAWQLNHVGSGFAGLGQLSGSLVSQSLASCLDCWSGSRGAISIRFCIRLLGHDTHHRI